MNDGRNTKEPVFPVGTVVAKGSPAYKGCDITPLEILGYSEGGETVYYIVALGDGVILQENNKEFRKVLTQVIYWGDMRGYISEH